MRDLNGDLLLNERLRAELNANSYELLDNFKEYFEEHFNKDPSLTKSDIFESWSMQKISNLQVCYTRIYKLLNEIEDKITELKSIKTY